MPQEERQRYGSPWVAINKQRHTWLPTAPEVQDCWKSMVDRPGSYNNPATGFRVGHSGVQEVKCHRLTITPLLGLRAYNNPGRPETWLGPGLQQPRTSRTCWVAYQALDPNNVLTTTPDVQNTVGTRLTTAPDVQTHVGWQAQALAPRVWPATSKQACK